MVVKAQIVPDGTTPSIRTDNGSIQLITGGSISPTNLFHSFSQFSISNGQVARFQHPSDIANIFVRVTGGNVSNIDGTLQTVADSNPNQTSSPNLFFLNPSGVIFNQNARLNLGGSLIVSTADSIRFSDGSEFSARQPTAPLLSVAVPIGLQFGNTTPTTIRNLATPTPGLRGASGRTLALIGGNVEMANGVLGVVNGRIELAAIGENSFVGFNTNANAWNYSGVQSFRDMNFSNLSSLQVGGSNAVQANLRGRNITFQSGSVLSSTASSPNSSLNINATGTLSLTGSQPVRIGQRDISQGSRIGSLLAAAGRGTDIQIKAQNLNLLDGGNIQSATQGSGQGGNITLDIADQINVSGIFDLTGLNSGIFTNSSGTAANLASGNSGNIFVRSSVLNIQNGGQINSLASNLSRGNSGNINVFTRDRLMISGVTVLPDNRGRPSAISAEARGAGNAGRIDITTNRLDVLGGGLIATSTFSGGQAGEIKIQAQDIELLGIGRSLDGRFLTNAQGLRISSGITSDAQANSTGPGANLLITTDRLSILDGAAIQAATFGAGDAGRISIIANESIKLQGSAASDLFPSSILAFSGGFIDGEGREFGNKNATGKGGDIAITTPNLKLNDGTQIVLGSLNPTPAAKGAGDRLTINADAIILDRAKLNAQTQSGKGGNMNLTANQLLLLRNNSQIITQAGSANQGGDGGDIDIRSPFIFAIDNENSDINANAFTGNGGNINLTATTILGLTPRDQLTPLSDITASSSFGRQGLIIVNSPEPDPNRGTVQLPNALTDPSNRIDQSCSANTTASGQFTVAGQGGLPSTPQTSVGTTPISRLANLPNTIKASKQPPTNLKSHEATIREAHQIKRLSNGKIRFMADVTQPAAPLLSGSKCQ
jgi:filamentous hemagglutinin family protein